MLFALRKKGLEAPLKKPVVLHNKFDALTVDVESPEEFPPLVTNAVVYDAELDACIPCGSKSEECRPCESWCCFGPKGI